MALTLLDEIPSKFNEFRALKLSNRAFLSEQKCRVGFFLNIVGFRALNSLEMENFKALNFSDLVYRF